MSWLYWALGSAFFAGLTAILAKIGVSNVNPNLATAIRTTVVLALCWGIVLASGIPLQAAQIDKKSWLFLILSGLATGASWLCYFHALQSGDVSRVAPIDKLSLVFVVILAAIFLQEKITLYTALGIFCMLCGLFLLAYRP